jgi:hypothetical protein
MQRLQRGLLKSMLSIVLSCLPRNDKVIVLHPGFLVWKAVHLPAQLQKRHKAFTGTQFQKIFPLPLIAFLPGLKIDLHT